MAVRLRHPPGQLQITELTLPQTPEWLLRTKRLINHSNVARGEAYQIRESSLRTSQEMMKDGERLEHSVDRLLKQRIQETISLKERLYKASSVLHEEIEQLTTDRLELINYFEAAKIPFRTCESRTSPFSVRALKPKAERVNDSANRMLQSVNIVFQKAQQEFQQIGNDAENVIRIMSQLYKRLQKDCKEKEEATKIDQSCIDLRSSFNTNSFTKSNAVMEFVPKGGNPMVNQIAAQFTAASNNTPEFWKRDSIRLIEESQRVRMESQKIRRSINRFLKQLRLKTTNFKSDTAKAIKNRMQLSESLNSSLTNQATQIEKEMQKAEEELVELTIFLKNKQSQLKIACDQLAIRRQRPKKEDVQDAASQALLKEVEHMQAAIANTQQNISNVEKEKTRLLMIHHSIQCDIEGKAASLDVDRRALDISEDEIPKRISTGQTKANNNFPPIPKQQRSTDFKPISTLSPPWARHG